MIVFFIYIEHLSLIKPNSSLLSWANYNFESLKPNKSANLLKKIKKVILEFILSSFDS